MLQKKLMSTNATYHADALESYHILLVEDNRGDAFLIRKSLEETFDGEYDFQFENTPRIVDALDLMGRKKFDLVLLDLNLLDSEGVASVSAIHATASNIPIIVYSGMDSPALKQKALMCGARHYLVKSRASPFALKFVIQQVLNL